VPEFPEAGVHDHDDGHQRADVDDEVEEHHLGALRWRHRDPPVPQPGLREHEVAGGTHRDEHEHALHDPEQQRDDERHDRTFGAGGRYTGRQTVR
jgi:hypothetical protein